MADNIKFAQLQTFTLAGAGVAIGDTTVTLKAFQTIAGVNLAISDFGTIGYGTMEPNSKDQEEQISFTGVTQNVNGTATLTGVKTVLTVAPYTETAGFAKSHTGGSTFVISNTAGFYNHFAVKDNDETITGLWGFSTSPTVPTPTTDYQASTKKYVDDSSVGIAGDETVAGIKTFSSSPIVPTPTTDMQASTKKYVDDQDALDVHLTGDQTVAGVKTFSSSPIVPTPTADMQASTKKYADDLAIAGSPNASTTAKGIVEEATQAEILAGTATGGTGARLFVNPSTLTTNGKLPATFIPSVKFGGTGVDGALTVSSGTTTIDLSGAQVVTKNYTSIAITGTGKIAFSNPHANGTIIILKSQGDVTLTSSDTTMIDTSNCGGAGGAINTAGTDGYAATNYFSTLTAATGGKGAASGSGAGGNAMAFSAQYPSGTFIYRNLVVGTAAGGGGGQTYAGGAGGVGGQGGGCVIIECAGAWNFTTANCIFVKGVVGANGNGSGTTAGTAGGGGGCGMFVAWYNSLTANSGTILTTGAAGGTNPNINQGSGGGGGGCIGGGAGAGSSGNNGGTGGSGYVSISENVSFI